MGVDHGGSVVRWPDQLLGRRGAGVALDRVQRPPQPARALEQADTLAEQLVHCGVPGPVPFVDRPDGPLDGGSTRSRRGIRVPAPAVGDHGLLHCGAQARATGATGR